MGFGGDTVEPIKTPRSNHMNSDRSLLKLQAEVGFLIRFHAKTALEELSCGCRPLSS